MFVHLCRFLIPVFALPEGKLPQEVEFVPSIQLFKKIVKNSLLKIYKTSAKRFFLFVF